MICTHPDRRVGEDKIGRCAFFIDRRTYKLPFVVSLKPTEAMLRNNCYGVETEDKDLFQWFFWLDWKKYSRQGVRGEWNLNKEFVKMAWEDYRRQALLDQPCAKHEEQISMRLGG